jgi:hypothetical protein
MNHGWMPGPKRGEARLLLCRAAGDCPLVRVAAAGSGSAAETARDE